MIRRRWFRGGREDVRCREVGRVLQSYLDDDVEEDFAAKIASHLEACKDCGLEAETYRQIKTSLAAQMPDVDPAALQRLRSFGQELTADDT